MSLGLRRIKQLKKVTLEELCEKLQRLATCKNIKVHWLKDPSAVKKLGWLGFVKLTRNTGKALNSLNIDLKELNNEKAN